jgi:hypothetical protein
MGKGGKMINQNFVIIDIETAPDVSLAKMLDDINDNNKLLPEPLPVYEEYESNRIEEEKQKIYAKNYKKQETVDAHILDVISFDYKKEYLALEQKRNDSINKLALFPPFAFIKLITVYSHTQDKDVINYYHNFDNDKTIENEIITKLCHKLYSLMTGTEVHELVTFNGKSFDIPVLIERGGIVGADIQYKWLEKLTIKGEKYNHYDMIEMRAYNNSPHNKLSLANNLVIRYGKEFAKHNIDFSLCTNLELIKYAIDETMKFAYWVKNHYGIKTINKNKYLKNINNLINKVKLED